MDRVGTIPMEPGSLLMERKMLGEIGERAQKLARTHLDQQGRVAGVLCPTLTFPSPDLSAVVTIGDDVSSGMDSS